MIVLYSGTPGSGKSYHAIAVIVGLLNKRRHVIANFDLALNEKERKYFHVIENFDLSPEAILKIVFANRDSKKRFEEGQILLVLDEAGSIFNSREWIGGARMEWVKFMTQHRKYGLNIILISQADRQLDRQMRYLIEYEKVHRKINRFSVFGLIPFTIFVAVERWYGISERLGCEFIWFRQKIANYYDTNKIYEALCEPKTKKRKASGRG